MVRIVRIDGRFTLDCPIGRGSSGEVWKAFDEARGQTPVAIKILHPEHTKSAKKLERFRLEAETLARLSHPSIAVLVASKLEGDELYIAMELAEGEPLQERLAARREPFPLSEIGALAAELAQAIDYIHAEGVVHGDLKPKNLIVNRRTVKILDFDTGAAGSLFYLAPEQVRNEPIDARTDLFALGTILFELTTFHRPWIRDLYDRPIPYSEGGGDSSLNPPEAIAQRIAVEPRPSPRALRPDLSEEADRAILRALAIDPDLRYNSAAELTEALVDQGST
jgi:serine/threonine-protein kinase